MFNKYSALSFSYNNDNELISFEFFEFQHIIALILLKYTILWYTISFLNILYAYFLLKCNTLIIFGLLYIFYIHIIYKNLVKISLLSNVLSTLAKENTDYFWDRKFLVLRCCVQTCAIYIYKKIIYIYKKISPNRPVSKHCSKTPIYIFSES